MIWIAIGFLVWLGFCIYAWNEKDGFIAAMALFGVGVVTAIIVSLTAGLGGIGYKNQHLTTYQLVAASDVIGGQGEFFLGSGTIDQELYYFYYKRSASGAITAGRVPADKTVLYEDGKLELQVYGVNSPDQWWAFGQRYATRYEIHVPEASVQPGAKFDLE